MENYEEILERISILDKICDDKIEAFDKLWFSNTEPFNEKSFDDYSKGRIQACGEDLKELITLERQERMLRPIILAELPTYGDVMSLADFIDCVNCGGFIDYDGYGHYVKNGMESNIEIFPSDIKFFMIRPEFDTIIWYNR